MPDFDIDFDERRRGEVIRYVTEKYGEDRVSMIVTYGTIKAKQAVKDSSRILGYPFAMGDRITKAMPASVMGKDVPLKEIFDTGHKRFGEGGEFRALYDGDNDVKRVVDTAIGIEGLKRQWGVHAAGVIMSSEPLIDVIPLLKRPADGAMITQFDYPTCEALGLIKMDFLGLRNLTVLDDAVRNIEANRGETVVLEDLTLDDPATYTLLARGDTLGVFQLDGGPMRALLRSMRPDTFEDISAVGALYRPGPMGADSHNKYARRKTGREPVEAIHPELAEPLADILGETYGLIVYQEQVMAIAQKLAGYTPGTGRHPAPGDGQEEEGGARQAVRRLLRPAWPSAATPWPRSRRCGTSCCRSPTTPSTRPTPRRTAWSPTGPPTSRPTTPPKYMAALLTSVKDDKDKMAIYLNECRRMKIQVLPPDVNESQATFTPVGHDIRFGLTAIRNVGVQRGLRRGRGPAAGGPLRRLQRLHGQGPGPGLQQAGHRVPGQGRRLRRHEAPPPGAGPGARDGGRPVRRHQAQRGDRPGLPLRRPRTDDGGPGFGISVAIPEVEEWDKMTLLGHEREMLGLYVSDHPLLGLEHLLSRGTDCSIGQLMLDEERADGSPITISGLVTSVQRKVTKRGDTWAMVTLEDLDGAIDVLLFPSAYQLASTLLTEDAIITVRGRLSRSKDQPEIHGQEVTVPDLTDGPVRSGGDQPAVDALHRPGGRAAQGRAPHPPGRDRGAAQAALARLDQGAPARRRAPRHLRPRPCSPT